MSPTVDPAQAYPRFSPDSFLYADVSRAPLDAGSEAKVRLLRAHVEDRYGGVAALNVRAYSAAYVSVPSGTPRADVAFLDCQRKGKTPKGLYDGSRHFADVPIPAGTVAAPGTDGHLVLWEAATDTLWEFWRASQRPDGSWQACWGGRIDRVSASDGAFEVPFGVGATGIAAAGYMVTLADARAGRIDHAVGLANPDPGRGLSFPARRHDGATKDPAALIEGSRLRLDADVDVEALPLTPLAKAIARAAQKYGFLVVDRAGAVSVVAEGVGRARTSGDADPWAAVLGATPAYRQLKGFPWDRLQVVAKDWGKPNGT